MSASVTPPPQAPPRKRHVVRWVVLGTVLFLVLVGCLGAIATTTTTTETSGGSTSSGPATSEEGAAEPTEPEAEPKAVKVEASKIVKEFQENELAADAKYDGKDLLITGRVDKIDTDMWDSEKYVLRLGGKWDILTVNCYDMSTDELATIKAGQTVTVRGTFDDGGDLGVEVNDCSLAGS